VTGSLKHPDVYFTPGYGSAARPSDYERWMMIQRYDGQWQVPLVLRRMPAGALDAASPYGYAGVYASPLLSEADRTRAWAETMEELRELGVVSVFLRHSPLVPQAPDHAGAVIMVDRHPTVMVQIQSPEAMWDALLGRCRTAIRKANAAGVTASVREAVPADLLAGSDFRTLYEQTMGRRGAAASYLFDDGYYSRLAAALGPDLLVAEARAANGKALSACLLMQHSRFLHYHLSGSSADGLQVGANNLMLWESCLFARGRGVEVFHLGGGLTADDSLYRFKSSFGGTRGVFRATGIIVDPGAYRLLSHARDELEGAAYFPAYRGRAR
jgi:hypothetical protein